MEMQVPTVTVDDLRQFHAKHFPNAPLPEQYLHGVEHETQEEYHHEGDDDLGCYADGVKRILTDEQIAMFRHSEIQRILLERRRRQEAGQPVHDTPGPEIAMEHSPTPLETASVREASPASDQSTPMSISSDDEQPQAASVERPQQKWTAISDKSRARAARNRKKNRKNHRARKKEERKLQEKLAKEAKLREEGEQGENESDEWDPWHQANGPDAQQEDAVDLDY